MRSKILLVQIVLSIVISTIGVGTRDQCLAKPNSNLTEEDKAQIIESVLQKESRKFKFLQKNGKILLAKSNIPQSLSPKLNGVEIVLIDTDEINVKRGTETGISYFAFSKIEVQESKVVVYFGRWRQSRVEYSAEGSIYEYKKMSKKWKGKLTGGFGAAT